MKQRASRFLFVAAVGCHGLASGALGCSSSPTTSDASTTSVGAADVTLSVSSPLAIPATAVVTLTVSGPGIATPIATTLSSAGTGYAGTIDAIPAGSGRTFDAALRDGATTLFSGSVTGVTVDAGKTARVDIFLQQVAPPSAFANAAPVLTALTASAVAAAPGDKVTLGATAVDADGDPLTYRWSATGGTFDDATRAATIWTADASSATLARTISIEVADPHGASTGASITIAPVAPTTGAATVTATVNHWPVVTNVLATPARLDVGDATQLSVVSGDADGDAVSYAWTTSCSGTFAAQTTATPTFTLGALASSGECSVTVTASDGRGGSGKGTFGIQTGKPVTGTLAPAPIFDTTTQSATVALSETTVDFAATAHSSTSSPVVLAWSATAGTFENVTGTTSRRWVAPSAFQSNATITVTAVAGAGIAKHDFVVAPTPFQPVSYSGTISGTLPHPSTHSIFFNGYLEQYKRDPVTHACRSDQIGTASYLNTQMSPLLPSSYGFTFNTGTTNGCARRVEVQAQWSEDTVTYLDTGFVLCGEDPTGVKTSFPGCNLVLR